MRITVVPGEFAQWVGALDLSHRWEVAKLLDQGVHYADIAERTGASTATITRINSWRRFGTGGYRLLLDRRKARSK